MMDFVIRLDRRYMGLRWGVSVNLLHNSRTLNTAFTPRYLKEFGLQERSGRLADALLLLNKARYGDEKSGLSKIYEMNLNRLLMKIKRQAREFYATLEPEPVFEYNKNPRTYSDKNRDESQPWPPIISFTTISSRIARIEKTIASLSKQTLKAHSINLYISSEPHLVDEGIQRENPILKDIAAMGVNIYYVPNIGPYRKQIPLIFQLNKAASSPRTPFITIDDDVIYPPDIVERLMLELETTEAVIAHRGREINLENGRITSYKAFPPPSARSSLLNMGTGKNGIAYRLGYFPTNLGDFVGPIIAPTADDIWCKWVTSSYCIPTVILEPTAAYDSSIDFEESKPSDKNGLFHKYNAKGKNDDAMENLETYFSFRSMGIASLLRGEKNG